MTEIERACEAETFTGPPLDTQSTTYVSISTVPAGYKPPVPTDVARFMLADTFIEEARRLGFGPLKERDVWKFINRIRRNIDV